MIVKFSRHAKRRARRYNLSESTIERILAGLDLQNGEHELIKEVQGYAYPIKIIVSVADNVLTVITNYPLKKGKRR